MDLRQLKSFVTTAKGLSFTRAAQDLGYAQSTITGQIQALEEELGAMLFERIGKQVRLTQEGATLYAYADRLLKLADEAREQVSSTGSPRGALMIGTPESFCVHRLAPALNRYRALHPGVELGIRFDAGGDYRAMLRQNLMDAAIILDVPCGEEDLVAHELLEEAMAVIAAPQHPLAGKHSVVPRDISGQTLVLTSPECNYRKLFDSILTQAGVKPGYVMGLSSNEAIKRFVCDGWGVGYLPYIVVAKELNDGQLLALPWQGPALNIKAQLVYHRDKWLSPALKAFLDLTLAEFGGYSI